jgi:hypothetical protein
MSTEMTYYFFVNIERSFRFDIIIIIYDVTVS